MSRLRRWFGGGVAQWLPAGLFGGAAGACAVAWLIWAEADLLAIAVCGPFRWIAFVVLYLVVTAGGYSFISTLQHLVRAIQYLRRPPSYFYYEASEHEGAFPELDLLGGPRSGCGLIILVPILIFGAVVSLPWFWLALRAVPAGRLALALVVGLPGGLLMGRYEARRQQAEHSSR